MVQVLCVHKLLLPVLLILSDVHLREVEAGRSPMDSRMGFAALEIPQV